MYIECKHNDGFEDQLTSNKQYQILELGDNSYRIENDKQEAAWYGRQHFELKLSA